MAEFSVDEHAGMALIHHPVRRLQLDDRARPVTGRQGPLDTGSARSTAFFTVDEELCGLSIVPRVSDYVFQLY
jgi:hypothetical protein